MWELKEYEESMFTVLDVVDEEGDMIKRFVAKKADYAEKKKKAQLIAAAPELLEATELALDFFKNCREDICVRHENIEYMGKVIKKAKNELIKTIWVRPAGYKQYLVFESGCNLKNIVDGFFNSDDWETFVNDMARAKENKDYVDFKNKDSVECSTIELKGEELDEEFEEVIEYKLVKMSVEEFDNIGEFNGW